MSNGEPLPGGGGESNPETGSLSGGVGPEEAELAARALEGLDAGLPGGRQGGFFRKGLGELTHGVKEAGGKVAGGIGGGVGAGLGKAGEAIGAVGGGIGGTVGETAHRMGNLSMKDLGGAVKIAARHWVDNLNPANLKDKDWLWRAGFGFGVAESLAFTALPLPLKGFAKAGINLVIIQGTHIALNLPRAREEARVKREHAGYQITINEEITKIAEKYSGAHQRIKDFALGLSAGAMYGSLTSAVYEVGKEALGWNLQAALQGRFKPGQGPAATGGATPAETPTGTPAPKTAGLVGGEAPKMPAPIRAPAPAIEATATPTPAAGPGGLPGGMETLHPPASPAPVTLPGTPHPATPTPSSTHVAPSGAEGGTPAPAGSEAPPAPVAKPPVVPPAQPAAPAPSLAEATPAAAPHIPETITLPKGSNPWTEVKGYLQQSLGREPSGPEIQEAVSRVLAENNIADTHNILPGDLKIHGVNEYIQQLKGGQPLPAITEQVTNIRAVEVGAEVAQKAITEQAQATEILANNVSSALEAAPDLFTDQAIAHGTNVGQMLQDAGYQVTWTGADAEMLGAHIAANNDTLTEMWHQMVAHQNIPENPFPVGLTELNELVADAQKGDKEALRKLLAALRYIPAGQKFRILNKEGISAVLGALG